jgi:hypothetical protein
LVPAVATGCSADQFAPLSVETFMTRSMSPQSLSLLRRASANATSVPRVVATMAGIRKLSYITPLSVSPTPKSV